MCQLPSLPLAIDLLAVSPPRSCFLVYICVLHAHCVKTEENVQEIWNKLDYSSCSLRKFNFCIPELFVPKCNLLFLGFLFWTKQTFYHLKQPLFPRSFLGELLIWGTILPKCFSFYLAIESFFINIQKISFLYLKYVYYYYYQGYDILCIKLSKCFCDKIISTLLSIYLFCYLHRWYISSNSLCQPLIEDASLILSALIEQTFSI